METGNWIIFKSEVGAHVTFPLLIDMDQMTGPLGDCLDSFLQNPQNQPFNLYLPISCLSDSTKSLVPTIITLFLFARTA